MGNISEFEHAVQLVIDHVSFEKPSTVQVFEATIRLYWFSALLFNAHIGRNILIAVVHNLSLSVSLPCLVNKRVH